MPSRFRRANMIQTSIDRGFGGMVCLCTADVGEIGALEDGEGSCGADMVLDKTDVAKMAAALLDEYRKRTEASVASSPTPSPKRAVVRSPGPGSRLLTLSRDNIFGDFKPLGSREDIFRDNGRGGAPPRSPSTSSRPLPAVSPLVFRPPPRDGGRLNALVKSTEF